LKNKKSKEVHVVANIDFEKEIDEDSEKKIKIEFKFFGKGIF